MLRQRPLHSLPPGGDCRSATAQLIAPRSDFVMAVAARAQPRQRVRVRMRCGLVRARTGLSPAAAARGVRSNTPHQSDIPEPTFPVIGTFQRAGPWPPEASVWQRLTSLGPRRMAHDQWGSESDEVV